MKYIAHRGNWSGAIPELENSPDYIDDAIKRGFDVEIDLWRTCGILSLGHDKPQYNIDSLYLNSNKDRLWIHAKNLDAASWLMKQDFNWFWHENDTFTLTSKGVPWAFPETFLAGCIVNQPKNDSVFWAQELWRKEQYLGICHDNLIYCQNIMNK